eukprot:Gregarina_sp_Poly_1__1485@NODE_1372_length_4272_cov_47_282045_g26_i1_p1_GENE_NODE_1372_length_4272_cov_47_282045_g26_i1NODE_1372_length_4272_cov_47_282045_g26_i1_p1_ORF_typecomplete_len619_score69_02AAA/PF00004_29/3_8e25AAA_22/PF13401_6/2_2e08RuvB_N/PF05496_12/3_2e08AFG1_ATPase/PF03969_16/1_3e07IstB_IS21/PF01695_17/2_2e07AAA_5/PF07728_14/3_4e07AAA_16/PF13191_6/2_7e06NACHT/PF05729_12/3_4e03NACHT/PF05729_12/2_1e05Bac_DnaA/PF00308_18/4_5e05TniB/PF05621_11/0_0059AAA_2/PF07724_14/9_1e05AAA_14/PF13173
MSPPQTISRNGTNTYQAMKNHEPIKQRIKLYGLRDYFGSKSCLQQPFFWPMPPLSKKNRRTSEKHPKNCTNRESSSLFSLQERSVFDSLNEFDNNEVTLNKKADDSTARFTEEVSPMKCDLSPSNLFLHENDIKNFEVEPYVYANEDTELINTNCLLLVEVPNTREIGLMAVRALKCVCRVKPATCMPPSPLGLSHVLWDSIKIRFGEEMLSKITGRLIRLCAHDTKISVPKHLTISILRLDCGLLNKGLNVLNFEKFRRNKNATNIVRTSFVPGMIYSTDQIYCFSLGGQLMFFRIARYVAKSPTAGGYANIFMIKNYSFSLELIEEPPVMDRELDTQNTEDSLTGLAKVGGLSSVKKVLEACVILPLTRPEIYFDEDKQLRSIRPPRGVLLYGPPGTGKTFLTSAIAEEIRSRWRQSENQFWSSPHIQHVEASRILNESPQVLTEIFDKCKSRFARQNQQSLLIFDEIDVLCPVREDAPERAVELTTIFLTHLDGIESSAGIVIMGTTNRPEQLDPAIRRPGRLDQELELDVPNVYERADIILKCAKRHRMTRAISSLEVAMELARDAHGFVPSDLDLWFIKSFQLAQQEYIDQQNYANAIPLTTHHFRKSLATVR